MICEMTGVQINPCPVCGKSKPDFLYFKYETVMICSNCARYLVRTSFTDKEKAKEELYKHWNKRTGSIVEEIK